MSCEAADVSAVAAPPQWCGGAVHAAYDTCVSNAIQLASHPLHEAMELGSALWSLTAEASAWQMCLLSVLAVVTVRQYFRWVMWTGLAAAFLAGQLIFVAWQMAMIALSVLCVSLLNIASKVWYVLESTSRWYRGGSISRRVALRRTLQAAGPWVEWAAAARELDSLDGKDAWRAEPPPNCDRIGAATTQLKSARESNDLQALMRLLSSMLVRDYEQTNSLALHTECRVGSKEAVERLHDELAAAVKHLAGAPCASLSYRERLQLFERASVCIGHTALCLSGGGSLAMYHLGVVQALIEAGTMPRIVSGTSGGAIVAGVLAVNTDQEMLSDIIQRDIAVRYLPDRWFPPLPQLLYNSVVLGSLVDNDVFARCTRRYYGDTTFEEAYRKTGRVVNINISSSSQGGSGARTALLLNALTAPHVLVRSAVHCSCSLPTVMKATTLLAKDPDTGEIKPYAGEGNTGSAPQWIDGSFTQDIPRDRLSELFHVTQTIVSQVNPHVVLTMKRHKGRATNSAFRRIESALSADVIYRLQMLAKLRLLPAMYGQDLKAIALKQKYTGDVTILPRLGGPQAVLRMVQNPAPEMMDYYIHEGRSAALQKLSHVQHLTRIEQLVNEAMRHCASLAASVGSPSTPAAVARAWKVPTSLSRSYSRSDLVTLHHEHRKSVGKEPGRRKSWSKKNGAARAIKTDADAEVAVGAARSPSIASSSDASDADDAELESALPRGRAQSTPTTCPGHVA